MLCAARKRCPVWPRLAIGRLSWSRSRILTEELTVVKRPNDDLFAGTTMTFGEHLEELRLCLFKSIAGLILGVMLGMLVANQVVLLIQVPLTNAIEKYYVSVAVDKLTATYGDKLSKDFVDFIKIYDITFEEVYFEETELQRLVAAASEAAKIESKSQENKRPTSEQLRESESKDKDVSSIKPDDRTMENLEAMANEPLGVPSTRMVHSRIWKPMRVNISALSAQEVFMIWMKASFVSGFVLTSPWIFYQVWLFVAAGLYPHEKNYVYIYLPFSILLFMAGAGTAFFFVFEPVLDFLFTFNKAMNINPEPRISEWLSFVLLLPIGFGVSFQLPLVMLFVHRIGIVSVEAYIQKWRIAILGIFVISAVLTPADPISLLFMAGPLTLLYFVGIGLCKWMPSNRNPYAGVEANLE